MKNAFNTNSRFFHKNMHVIKKKEIFDRKVSKLQHFSKVLSNVGGNTLFWRGHYLIHELGSMFFFLSSMENILVNQLVFDFFLNLKWARTEQKKNYWSGTQLYLSIWSLS